MQTHRHYNVTELLPAQTRLSEGLKDRLRPVLCRLLETVSIVYSEVVISRLYGTLRHKLFCALRLSFFTHFRAWYLPHRKPECAVRPTGAPGRRRVSLHHWRGLSLPGWASSGTGNEGGSGRPGWSAHCPGHGLAFCYEMHFPVSWYDGAQ